jgi:hypothetical protein
MPHNSNLPQGRLADLKIAMYADGKIPFGSPQRFSAHEEEELPRQKDRAICCGWIQHSRSNFSSPGLFLPLCKGTLRMYTDYRAANSITTNNCYPFPHLKVLLNSMHGFCWFTKLDMAAGYHQIRIATAGMQKPVFATSFGLDELGDLPFGMENAPSQFMQMMNSILESMKCNLIIAYLDDIIIHSCTLVEHILHV